MCKNLRQSCGKNIVNFVLLLVLLIVYISGCDAIPKYTRESPYITENVYLPDDKYNSPIAYSYTQDILPLDTRIKNFIEETNEGCSVLIVKKVSSKTYYSEDSEGNIDTAYTDTIATILDIVDGKGDKHLSFEPGGEVHLLEMFTCDYNGDYYYGTEDLVYDFDYDTITPNYRMPIVHNFIGSSRFTDIYGLGIKEKSHIVDTISPFLLFDSTYIIFLDESFCADDERTLNLAPRNMIEGMYVKYQAYEITLSAYNTAKTAINNQSFEAGMYKDIHSKSPYEDYYRTVKAAYEKFVISTESDAEMGGTGN